MEYTWAEDSKPTIYTAVTGKTANSAAPLRPREVDLILDEMRVSGSGEAPLRHMLKEGAQNPFVARMLRQIPQGKQIEITTLAVNIAGQVDEDNANLLKLDFNENFNSYTQNRTELERQHALYAAGSKEYNSESAYRAFNVMRSQMAHVNAVFIHEMGHAKENTGMQDFQGREFYQCQNTETGKTLSFQMRRDAQTGERVRVYNDVDANGKAVSFVLKNDENGNPKAFSFDIKTGTGALLDHPVSKTPLILASTKDMNIPQAFFAEKMCEVEKAALDDVTTSEIHLANESVGRFSDELGSEGLYRPSDTANPYLQLKLLQNREALEQSGRYKDNPEALQLVAQQQTAVQIMRDYAGSADDMVNQITDTTNAARRQKVYDNLTNVTWNEKDEQRLVELYDDIYVKGKGAQTSSPEVYRQFLENEEVQEIGKKMHAREVLCWQTVYVKQACGNVAYSEMEQPFGKGNPELAAAQQEALLQKYGHAPEMVEVIRAVGDTDNTFSSFRGTVENSKRYVWNDMVNAYRQKNQNPELSVIDLMNKAAKKRYDEKHGISPKNTKEQAEQHKKDRQNKRREKRKSENVTAQTNSDTALAQDNKNTGLMATLNQAQERKEPTGDTLVRPDNQATYV